MRFSRLLTEAAIQARRRGDAEVLGVCDDSRCCGAGSCFVAVRGTCDDGHKHICAAAAAGCEAVVCQDTSTVPAGLPCAVVEDTRRVAGPLAQAIRGWPARKLINIAVTGTNGKSTATHLIAAILRAGGFQPAMLGTIGYKTGSRSIPARTTTPGAVALAEMMEEMLAAGRTHLVMEVSSHALDQRRACGIDFRVGVFTNLSGDHLDYHGTMDAYLAAKRRLFEALAASGSAVINRDDPAGEVIAQATKAAVTWYGLSPAADLRGRIEQIDDTGSKFTLIRGGEQAQVTTSLIGRHNVFNCLAAAGACAVLGVELPIIAAALSGVHRIPGRLERVRVDAPYDVFVDYAHTDDALANVLSSLRPVTRGRILVVFGCGGDRDHTKRPRMARVARDLADVVVITSDNPRSEKPEAIIDDIVAGLQDVDNEEVRVEPDRRTAIELAVSLAESGDVVLVAGKGHENYQVIGSKRIHFDDVEVAAEAVQKQKERL